MVWAAKNVLPGNFQVRGKLNSTKIILPIIVSCISKIKSIISKQIENSHTEECSSQLWVCVLIKTNVILPI
jgi:hypothetical protein